MQKLHSLKYGAAASGAAAMLLAAHVSRQQRKYDNLQYDVNGNLICLRQLRNCSELDRNAYTVDIIDKLHGPATWRILAAASQSRTQPVQDHINGWLSWLTTGTHRLIEITFDSEYTITVGMGLADNLTDLVIQINDPVMSRLLLMKHKNYMYPTHNSDSCQVQARALTDPEPLNDEQRELLTICLTAADCDVKGGIGVLRVPLLNSKFDLLISKLHRVYDRQKTGYYMSCHYFTILFRDNPKGLIKLITRKEDERMSQNISPDSNSSSQPLL